MASAAAASVAARPLPPSGRGTPERRAAFRRSHSPEPGRPRDRRARARSSPPRDSRRRRRHAPGGGDPESARRGRAPSLQARHSARRVAGEQAADSDDHVDREALVGIVVTRQRRRPPAELDDLRHIARLGGGLRRLDEHLDRLRLSASAAIFGGAAGEDRREPQPAARIGARSCRADASSSARTATLGDEAVSTVEQGERVVGAAGEPRIVCGGHGGGARAPRRRWTARRRARVRGPRPRTRSCAAPDVPRAPTRRRPRRPHRATRPRGGGRDGPRPARCRARPQAPDGRLDAARTWHRRRA